MSDVFIRNFLGKTPRWYKLTILFFLIINPIVFFFVSPFLAGWMLLLEFIFTLALALKCYPVPSGGLLVLQAVIIGLTSAEKVYDEVAVNLPVLLLIVFMVAAVFYLKDVVFLVFTKLFISIKNKQLLCLTFCVLCASLAAFLDALAIMAAIIAVCFNCYAIYHRVALEFADRGDGQAEMEEFKGFMRNFIMHGAAGAIMGGNMTIVGVPHNLMIATRLGWSFGDFLQQVAMIAIPVILAGFALCVFLETVKFPGYGYKLPQRAYDAIVKDYNSKFARLNKQALFEYALQGTTAVLLFVALAFHLAEVGLIGIALMIIIAAFKGMTKEHDYAEAFNNAMPFTLLIMIFFAVLAVVDDQQLVKPLIQWALTFGGKTQLLTLFFTNGSLSMVSDNIFVASVFMNEIEVAYNLGQGFDREWFEKLGVAVSMGTNVPTMGTPNGHAALLFLLTSSLAPLINLSYWQMFKLALPYTVVLTATGALSILFLM
ncbi:MAG: hypothetical protein FWC43_13145 [Planctomycetaceae bacterium]|nr:hypothetical protein [Planctomycetaceae bacterium]